MHELSLASNMIEKVLEVAEKNRVTKILKIQLKFGKFALVVEDQFRFCIDLLKKEHEIISDMEVEIAWEDGIIECSECEYWGPCNTPDGSIDSPDLILSFKCPNCGSYQTRIVQGRDTEIVNISVS